MALQIIRNNIINVEADAIVNTANPAVAVGPGVDCAIYTAAGWDKLLKARAQIGRMNPGEAAWTPAFDLNAKYIIHTVGPEWRGGGFGERETVAKCYRRSLELASELDCESIAFPLIATGTYGFPKDEALRIAIAEISSFLLANEMEVMLVVYDKESFEVSGKLFSDIKMFIGDADVEEHMMMRANQADLADLAPRTSRSARFAKPEQSQRRERRGLLERLREIGQSRSREERDYSDFEEINANKSYAMPAPQEDSSLHFGGEEDYSLSDDCMEAPMLDEQSMSDMSPLLEMSPILIEERATGAIPPFIEEQQEDRATGVFQPLMEDRAIGAFPSPQESLDERLKHLDKTFQQYLFMLIDRRGLSDPDVYKKANIDRKHFSKIRSNVEYTPSKRTALALAVALELSLDETKDLLSRAGLALSPAMLSDKIIEYCIETGNYDIYEINCILFKYDQPTLGA